MGYELRTEQMTLEEIKAKSSSNFIEEVIPVPLQVIVESDFEGFLNILEYKLLGDKGILLDMEYNVVGTGMSDDLHIKVSGYADLMGED